MLALTLVDWDDTLFPSSQYAQDQIAALEPVICHFLDELVKRSHAVVIVTNSQEAWIPLCLQNTNWTELRKRLETISIVSARNLFEHETTDPTEWKKRTFRSLIASYPVQQVVSIGDGPSEREALFSSDTSSLCKSVMTLTRPRADQIHLQCKLLCGLMDWLYQLPHTVDYCVRVTPVN